MKRLSTRQQKIDAGCALSDCGATLCKFCPRKDTKHILADFLRLGPHTVVDERNALAAVIGLRNLLR